MSKIVCFRAKKDMQIYTPDGIMQYKKGACGKADKDIVQFAANDNNACFISKGAFKHYLNRTKKVLNNIKTLKANIKGREVVRGSIMYSELNDGHQVRVFVGI